MPHLVSSALVKRSRFRLDLDDFDAIIEVLRSGSISFRVIVEGNLLADPYEIPATPKRAIHQVDIEAHEPFVRFRFGQVADHSFCELAVDDDHPGGRPLLDRIEHVSLSSGAAAPCQVSRRENVPWILIRRFLIALVVIGMCLVPALVLLTGMALDGTPDQQMNANAILIALGLGTAFVAMVFFSCVYTISANPALVTERKSKSRKEPLDALEF